MSDINFISSGTAGKLSGLLNRKPVGGTKVSTGFANHNNRIVSAVTCGALADGGSNIYNAVPAALKTDDLTFEEFDDCWLYADGDPLSPGEHYLAYLYGQRTISVDGEDVTRDVWLTRQPHSQGSARKFRIMDNPTQDLSGIYYWPGLPEDFRQYGDASLAPGDYDEVPKDDGSNYVWLTFFYQPAIYGAWVGPTPKVGDVYEFVDMEGTIQIDTDYPDLINWPGDMPLELWQTMFRKEAASIRIVSGTHDVGDLSGNSYKTGNNSVFFFLGVFEGYDDAGDGQFDYEGIYCWVVPAYQDAIVPMSGYQLPTSGSIVTGVDMHDLASYEIVLPVGTVGPDGESDGSTPQNISAEIFETTDRPTPIGCTCGTDGSGNPITVLLYGP